MFKILDGVCTPKRGTKYSAYVDLFAREDVTIGAGETKIVKLGVKIDFEKLKEKILKNPIDFIGLAGEFTTLLSDDTIIQRALKSNYLEIALRSSLGAKGLIIANGIGIIDLDYPDEIGLIIHNPCSLEQVRIWNKQNIGNEVSFEYRTKEFFKISKGDKVAQCTLKEHKGYLMGYESDVVRTGGFGSTDNKVEAPVFDKPDFFKCNVVN